MFSCSCSSEVSISGFLTSKTFQLNPRHTLSRRHQHQAPWRSGSPTAIRGLLKLCSNSSSSLWKASAISVVAPLLGASCVLWNLMAAPGCTCERSFSSEGFDGRRKRKDGKWVISYIPVAWGLLMLLVIFLNVSFQQWCHEWSCTLWEKKSLHTEEFSYIVQWQFSLGWFLLIPKDPVKL